MIRRIKFKELIDLVPGELLFYFDKGSLYSVTYLGLSFTYGLLTSSAVTNELSLPEKLPLNFDERYLPEYVVGVNVEEPFGIAWEGNGYTVSKIRVYLKHANKSFETEDISKLRLFLDAP